jgi:hypothetical protein
VAISPFGVVNYMTVYLGDVLTSTVKVRLSPCQCQLAFVRRSGFLGLIVSCAVMRSR